MSFLASSYDIELDDNEDAKYWRFVGEEWTWFKLNDEQVKWIESAGKRRDKFGKEKTRVNYSKGDSLPLHISGIASELVVSYFTKEKINQIELRSKSMADVGNDTEVKSTRYSKNWAMYVNESQLDRSRRYIFCLTYLYPKYVAILGWTFGSAFPPAPVSLSWRPGENAYRLPWQSLLPMKDWQHALV